MTDEAGSLTFDSVQSWLNAHPTAVENAPDLVAMAQLLARELESADTKEIPALVHQYRMIREAIAGVVQGEGDGSEDFAASLRATVRNPKDSG